MKSNKSSKNSEWEQEHKYQSKELIFTDGEHHYRGYISRTGSPFTDWTYDHEVYGDCEEELAIVEKKTISIEKWIEV